MASVALSTYNKSGRFEMERLASAIACIAITQSPSALADETKCTTVKECAEVMVDLAKELRAENRDLAGELVKLRAELDSLKIMLKSTHIVLERGDRVEAARQTDGNMRAHGKCSGGKKVVGYHCQIDHGGGHLQNIGIDGDGWLCLWSATSKDFSGHGYPVCASINSNSRPSFTRP